MAKDVLCDVKNCEYWERGDRCSAETIYVVSQRGDEARNVEETVCQTFEPAHE